PQTGGTASHAALVARGMGRPCVVGASAIDVDVRQRKFSANGTTIKEGDEITIDGTTGDVYVGNVPTIEARSLNQHPAASSILRWADELLRLEVWANADYPRDAAKARENGAQGVGLCRTEHMFMEQDRLPIVQAMIMATSTEEREKQLAKLLPIQRGDFEGIFKEMAGRPEIMIPLAGTVAELRTVHAELKPVAELVQKEMGVRVPYKFGTMIEIPRAALTAGEIAQEAEFFSFGTNDLTQTTFGFSRDDA